MASYEILDETAGGWKKVEYTGIGQTGYVSPDGTPGGKLDKDAQRAYAASKGQETRQQGRDETGRFTGEVETVDADEPESVDVGVTDDFADRRGVTRSRWDYTDRLEGVSTDNITAADEWTQREWGVPIDEYPAEQRLDELMERLEQTHESDPHDGYRWGVRYIVIQDETETVREIDWEYREAVISHAGSAVDERREFSKLTTKMREFRDKSFLILEFEERLEQLAKLQADYEKVLMYHTLQEARNYA